jgi:hypothetical protein
LGGTIVTVTKPPKRPRDPNQLAKAIVDIATGEVEDGEQSATAQRAAKAGSLGGPARAKALTPAQRSEIASIAASARWKKF